jgi:hypothetical protein
MISVDLSRFVALNALSDGMPVSFTFRLSFAVGLLAGQAFCSGDSGSSNWDIRRRGAALLVLEL